MAKINQYLTFGAASEANVLQHEQYSELNARKSGFVKGIAKSQEVNTPIRQSSVITSAVAQFISNKTDTDMLDDGDVLSIVERLEETVKNCIPAVDKPALDDYVPTSRKINKKTLATDIELTADDVGALPVSNKLDSSYEIEKDSNFKGRLQQNGFDVLTSASEMMANYVNYMKLGDSLKLEAVPYNRAIFFPQFIVHARSGRSTHGDHAESTYPSSVKINILLNNKSIGGVDLDSREATIGFGQAEGVIEANKEATIKITKKLKYESLTTYPKTLIFIVKRV